MQWFEYIIIGFAVIYVALVIVLTIVKKKVKKYGCNGSCSSCSQMCVCKTKDQLLKEYHELNAK